MRVFGYKVHAHGQGARRDLHAGHEHVIDESLQLVHWEGKEQLKVVLFILSDFPDSENKNVFFSFSHIVTEQKYI